MAKHWFLEDGHTKFRKAVADIIERAAEDICQSNASETLGDEHLQCQHLFSKMYALMQAGQRDLSNALLCCSRVPNPVVELRYYKSRVRRKKGGAKSQFVEKETGADFALTLRVDLPGVLQAERSVLGQAKILGRPSVELDIEQLDLLLKVAGAESGAYLLWHTDLSPTVVTAENVTSHTRTHGKDRLYPGLCELGQSFSDFFSETFLGLWFGKDYDPVKEGEHPPASSIPILYHFLHRGLPPPNVVYFGLGSADQMQLPPGVYVTDVTDMGE